MIKTGKELAAACKDVAQNYKTLYVLGAFGWTMSAANKKRAKDAYSYNARKDRAAKIDTATADTFAFDCVCLIKALLWGWNGNTGDQYGGAEYESNGVPDIDDSAMINRCTDVSSDFSNIQIGEVVWMQGHIGVYIGDGLAVECSPRWKDGVQITAVHNIGSKVGYNGRKWTKHGKLPFVEYSVETVQNPEKKPDYSISMRYLRKGCVGEDVRALQILLIGHGYDCGSRGADGEFGTKTDEAVRAFQKKYRLDVDGVAGRDTVGILMGA